MERLKTANYLQKRIIYSLFNEEWYNSMKLFKIIMNYKLGNKYEMSPILKHMISPDSIVLDIGANMGQYACRFNNLVKKGSGHVYSFEPVQANYTSLKSMKSKLHLNHVTINQLGVSNTITETTINIPLFNNGLVVGTRASLLQMENIKHKTEKIKVTTIDSFIAENNIQKVDFIKCDTEGNESNVLEGGKKTIERFLPMLSFEMSYKSESTTWLKNIGYEMYYYNEKADKLTKISDHQTGNLVLINSIKVANFSSIIQND
ncbi:MAG: FkbM family methyltransferase [Bacteroidota bacterium]